HYIGIPPGTTYQQMHWLQPELGSFLFGSWRGLFTWTPLFLIATVGLLLGLARGPSGMRYGALVLLLAVYFNSSIPLWWAGCNFGAPRIVNDAVIFALGLGYLLSLRPRLASHYAVHALGIALCALNWLLIVRYFSHDLPEHGYVSWHNLYVETL